MKPMRAFIPLCLTLACSSSTDECGFGVHTSGIRFATADAGVAPEVVSASVVGVYLEQPDQHASLACTATRVAPAAYLTARHCVSDDGGALVLRAGTRAPASACAGRRLRAVRVAQTDLHPELDLALLVSDEPKSVPERVPSMVVSSIPPSPGELLYIAGYGLTEQWSLGELRSLGAAVTTVGNTQIEVQGVGGGACVGDSGGPLYSLENDQATLRGVLSTGSASCLGADQYVNIAEAHDWIRNKLRESSK